MKPSIVLLTLLLVLGPSAAFADPPEPDPAAEKGGLIVAPAQLQAGEQAQVVGTGCASGIQVQFEVYNPDLSSSAEAIAKADGTFSQTITFPASTPVGRTWLRATCQTPDSRRRIMQTVLLITRPDFLITGVNLAFGAGSTLMVFGLGLLVLRGPSRRGPRRKS